MLPRPCSLVPANHAPSDRPAMSSVVGFSPALLRFSPMPPVSPLWVPPPRRRRALQSTRWLPQSKSRQHVRRHARSVCTDTWDRLPSRLAGRLIYILPRAILRSVQPGAGCGCCSGRRRAMIDLRVEQKEVRVAEIDSTPAEELERKLATILSADVAEYSRLMAEDEEQTLRTFRGHKEVFEKLVALHRGRVFNTAGHAILAEFGSAVEAVRCATEIQAALRTRNDQLPEDRQVRFRIGVNLGDVMVQGQDLLGDGVNVAARLQGAAEPGGICIAGSVYDQIRNKLSLAFTPLGERNYKNIPHAVRTFAIAGADGLGELPAPARQRRIGRRQLRLIAAAALLLIASGAAIWGYSDY